MFELRPHLAEDGFVELIHRLKKTTGLEIAYFMEGDEIKSVAGFRVSEWLAGGKYLEIEDLVSKSTERSKGYGGELFDWLKRFAAQQGCRQLRLVSNVRRLGAHRFICGKEWCARPITFR